MAATSRPASYRSAAPCHRAFDHRRLDLLPYLEPRFRPELAHGLLHLGLVGLLRRVSGLRWAPMDECEERDRAA